MKALASGGMGEALRHLLEKIPEAFSLDAISRAADAGHTDLAVQLVELARRMGYDYGPALDKAFFEAIYSDRRETAVRLLQLGADANVPHAFINAVYQASPEFIRRLLQAGADPTRREENGSRALDAAILRIEQQPSPEAREVLLLMLQLTPDPCSRMSATGRAISERTIGVLSEIEPQCDWASLVTRADH